MMDWTIFFSNMAPILGLILGNAAFIIPLFLWSRSESRADYRHLESAMKNLECSTSVQINAIHLEMKDFHGRLCAIEERNRGK